MFVLLLDGTTGTAAGTRLFDKNDDTEEVFGGDGKRDKNDGNVVGNDNKDDADCGQKWKFPFFERVDIVESKSVLGTVYDGIFSQRYYSPVREREGEREK